MCHLHINEVFENVWEECGELMEKGERGLDKSTCKKQRYKVEQKGQVIKRSGFYSNPSYMYMWKYQADFSFHIISVQIVMIMGPW